MLTKTKAAAVAAILLGSVTGAVADAQFDVNIYQPTVQNNALSAYAQASPRAAAPRAAKPFTIEEKILFDRASQRS
jgi:hypothetical protein